jgi:hypothetical protein
MKNALLAVCCMLFSFGFSQEWTKEQLQLLDYYGLEKSDHRGLVLSTNLSDCENAVSVEKAIIQFFTTDLRKDIITLCIISDPENISGHTLDLFEVTALYIQITEKKNK